MPKVDKRTKYTLTLNLTKNGVRRADEERLMEVWPELGDGQGDDAPGCCRCSSRSGFSTPRECSRPVLKQMGFAFKGIDALDAKSLARRRA